MSERSWRSALGVTVALLAAMAVSSALILVYGRSPAQVYSLLLARTWGDAYGIGQVLFKATPLLFTGLAVTVAFRAGLFNVGGEGQLLGGSFVTALVGAALPGWTGLLAAILAGAAAGAALGAIPGALKALSGAHEVITTIMLNFIVSALILWIGREHVFLDQTVHTAPVHTRLPGLGLGASAGSVAFVLAVLAAGACAAWLAWTRLGFELRAVGQNPAAAQAAGISPRAVTALAMVISGGLAGLTGSATVLGYKGYFEEGLGAGMGYMGIAVALVARARPLLVIPAALLFGTLSHGGLAVNSLVPKEIVEVVQAVIILGVAMTTAEIGGRLREAA